MSTTIETAPSSELVLPDELIGLQHRAAQIEYLDVDAGTILVRIAPYGREAQIGEKTWETFDRGAFAAAANAPHRVKMWHEHNGPLIGHALSVEDRPDGSWALGKFSQTVAAQEARELARDGTLDQVSVTFNPRRDWMRVDKRSDGFHIAHRRAFMLGFALVPHGAYDDGGFVKQVRDLTAGDAEEQAARERELAERQRRERIARLRDLTH